MVQTPKNLSGGAMLFRPLLALMMADSAASVHAAAALRTARAPTTMPQVTMSAASQDRRSVLLSAASAAIFSLPARAVADQKAAPSFQGVFKDPKHPNGYRVLVGDADNKGTMTLQDEPDGKVFSIPIIVKKEEQVTLTIDFSVKGGPKDVVAILNKDSSISFPDGNLWKKEGGVVGVFSDGFNPERLRIIRAEKGDALVLDLIRGPNGDKTVSGKIAKPDVTFDFPGKPGDKGVVDSKKGTISFADGNVWTKL